MQHNAIGNDGAHAIAQLTSLTSLSIALTDVGTVGLQALAALPELRHLNVTGISLGVDGARALLGMTTLRHLGLAQDQLLLLATTAVLAGMALERVDLQFEFAEQGRVREPRFVALDLANGGASLAAAVARALKTEDAVAAAIKHRANREVEVFF